jgi:hypothetical protein
MHFYLIFGGQFCAKSGGHFHAESGGHFETKNSGHFRRNLHYKSWRHGGCLIVIVRCAATPYSKTLCVMLVDIGLELTPINEKKILDMDKLKTEKNKHHKKTMEK